jgi:ribosome modulation factor
MSLQRYSAVVVAALLVPTGAGAWPAPLRESMARDARRLLPRSLAELMLDREKEILEEAARFPPELTQAVAADLGQGTLRPETLAALESRAGEAVALIRDRRVSEGIIRLGSLLRVPADLSDPVLTRGPEGYPAGVTREYYAFVTTNLQKIPVVLDNPAALRLERKALGPYWQGLLGRSRDHSPVIQVELFKNGRVVDHRTLDFRSPVFGVASLAYSRSVTAIAATWLAVWREVRGDLTRMRTPLELLPQEPSPRSASPAPLPTVPPEASRLRGQEMRNP